MITNYFSERRSCRNFKNKKINHKILEEIIEKAMKAPTCGNMQLYSIVITEQEDNRKKLAEFHYNQPASVTAPIILTVCADFNRFTEWCKINNADESFNNFHSFITALIDAVIFTQQIVTIAESDGFGTCYLGTVIYNAKAISDLLELPELVIPVTSIAIGYPEEEGEKTLRLEKEAVIHFEKYRKKNADIIKEIYKKIEDIPENEKFIRENNKQNLAQVFSEIRYPKDLNESISKTFYDLIKEKGF